MCCEPRVEFSTFFNRIFAKIQATCVARWCFHSAKSPASSKPRENQDVNFAEGTNETRCQKSLSIDLFGNSSFSSPDLELSTHSCDLPGKPYAGQSISGSMHYRQCMQYDADHVAIQHPDKQL